MLNTIITEMKIKTMTATASHSLGYVFFCIRHVFTVPQRAHTEGREELQEAALSFHLSPC